jgi:arylsulfatase A
LFATCADLLGKKLPGAAAEDSYSIWPVVSGQKYKSPIREATVHHSLMGMYAIRQGDWKLILGEGGGGFRTSREDARFKGRGQLYNLKNDPAEKVNLWDTHPEIVSKLSALLDTYRQSGSSKLKTDD